MFPRSGQFLRFAWGRSRLPAGGKFTEKMRIDATSNDITHLPQAHTCFFSIELPAYNSLEMMRDKIVKAITFCTVRHTGTHGQKLIEGRSRWAEQIRAVGEQSRSKAEQMQSGCGAEQSSAAHCQSVAIEMRRTAICSCHWLSVTDDQPSRSPSVCSLSVCRFTSLILLSPLSSPLPLCLQSMELI